MEAPTLPETFRLPPDLHQESWDPRMIIALFEIGSISLFFWSSLLSLKKNSNQISEQLTAQKFEKVLNKIEGILKNITGFEKTTDAIVSFEDTTVSDDASELKEKIRKLDQINKTLFKNLLTSLDPEKFQSAKKQEKILENQNSEDTVHFARDLVNHSEEKRALNETQPSKEKAKYGLLHAQEENIKLRNNMEQLLQKAEHWSKQHTELSGLIKSYQKSQHDIRELLENNGVHFQIQPNNKMSANYEMEEQVRKLQHDTYSLHLTAALLENECQILQQRVGILNQLHYEKERAQTDNEQGKKEKKPSEAEKVGTHKQRMKQMEGTLQKRDNFYIRLDVCRNKKAHNNWFNSRIARRGLVGKKRSASRPR
ncbi:spermatogenic leucine zipper protein 1 [Elephas maximus indicus]|uniref:spermatogenic leucine zipper protein 1 n=1 Tax=Elephas maximus indicus TaxID=99487 RepID=UPI002115D93C|nr:spermatogenic leucine zipper protein 1 [Elephas maximus indicus]